MMAEVDREPVEDSIGKWRAAARYYAKEAQDLFVDDGLDGDEHAARMVDVTTLASMATMYFALAADAERFGKLPPALDPDE
ncbi:hypothetical protein SEA_AMOHNITION_43 [Mycobacterium phage Amohnition]|uniref:Uncharacterized protein n=1 Tax=Mycobacterium phage Amohnition TaxID=2015874 RepID=A0A222ZNG8_9CAUD|nr:hypothetical protein I5G85_gp56 [Mycobacterium phage Amohnition]ASR86323.1 hypothetical protein SEA_AMOHNITION_43 [Mycobacterium phage Amohnition]